MLFLLGNLLTALVVIDSQIHACFTSEVLERLTKVHSLDFHDKSKDIATTTRRKVVPDVFVGTNDKTRRLFSTKWTKSLEVTPRSFEHHVFANYVLNIELGADFFFSILHTHSIALFTSVSVCA
ncbi:hypothetical protein D3C87_1869770 [compost metagenome]